jgi:outer membrane lipoprotein-sorting protein
MVRKSRLWMIFVFGILLVLAACGEKSQEDVVKKLGESVNGLTGYKTNVEMKMTTGQEDQVFKIDVWHKKKEFYRVALSSNKEDKGGQIILKNKDGVFVLTPELKKSFKFQSDWPDNSSQPYLYQSLVEDIKNDKEAEFKTDEKHYIFTTKTNYQSNNNLPYQVIYIDKESYTPVMVRVLDTDDKTAVEVKFSNFKLNPSFKDSDFAIDQNMANVSEDDGIPTSGDGMPDELRVMVPVNTVGAELTDRVEVDLKDGKRVISTFTGERNFTLVQEKRDVVETLTSPVEVSGDIVNLGYAVGVLSDNAVEWDYEGMSFYLASDQLTKEELLEVAQSVQGQEVK